MNINLFDLTCGVYLFPMVSYLLFGMSSVFHAVAKDITGFIGKLASLVNTHSRLCDIYPCVFT